MEFSAEDVAKVRKVIQTMTLGILKLRKENRPERAKHNEYEFFYTFLGDRI